MFLTVELGINLIGNVEVLAVGNKAGHTKAVRDATELTHDGETGSASKS